MNVLEAHPFVHGCLQGAMKMPITKMRTTALLALLAGGCSTQVVATSLTTPTSTPTPMPFSTYFLADPPIDGVTGDAISSNGCDEDQLATYKENLGSDQFQIREEATRCLI